MPHARPSIDGIPAGLAQVAALAALVLVGSACGDGVRSGPPASARSGPTEVGAPPAFERIALRLEMNGAEGDAALVVEVAATHGLRRLTVTDPGGRIVIDARAGEAVAPGADEVRVQAKELSPHGYPEGSYGIEAITADGSRLSSSASLLFDLLPAPDLLPGLLEPEPVHPDAVEIGWAPVPDAEGYVVEIEDAEEKILSVTLPASADHFAVPAGILDEEAEYEVNVVVVSASGNRTESDGWIITGAR